MRTHCTAHVANAEVYSTLDARTLPHTSITGADVCLFTFGISDVRNFVEMFGNRSKRFDAVDEVVKVN